MTRPSGVFSLLRKQTDEDVAMFQQALAVIEATQPENLLQRGMVRGDLVRAIKRKAALDSFASVGGAEQVSA